MPLTNEQRELARINRIRAARGQRLKTNDDMVNAPIEPVPIGPNNQNEIRNTGGRKKSKRRIGRRRKTRKHR